MVYCIAGMFLRSPQSILIRAITYDGKLLVCLGQVRVKFEIGISGKLRWWWWLL